MTDGLSGELHEVTTIQRIKMIEIINNLTPEKYNEMLPYIEYNYQLVKQDTFENNISQFFDNFFELNNI